jgi:hypothetical protein
LAAVVDTGNVGVVTDIYLDELFWSRGPWLFELVIWYSYDFRDSSGFENPDFTFLVQGPNDSLFSS